MSDLMTVQQPRLHPIAKEAVDYLLKHYDLVPKGSGSQDDQRASFAQALQDEHDFLVLSADQYEQEQGGGSPVANRLRSSAYMISRILHRWRGGKVTFDTKALKFGLEDINDE